MPLFALVDCNNFYASCERLFRPELKGRPVVVLSNNDGCVIARSSEAKALGIPMGAPAFQWERQFRASGVAVFSSNFPLYGDLSARIMTTLEGLAPRVEVYSIDEAFLDLTGVADPVALCREIRERVLRWVGIPVSIGLARTKTLAKLVNGVAKKQPGHGGVFSLEQGRDTEAVLGVTDVGDVEPGAKPEFGPGTDVLAGGSKVEGGEVEAHAIPRRTSRCGAAPRPARRIMSATLKIRWAECSGRFRPVPYQSWM